eukprot:5137883-Prymnesium_polylepis.1
MGDSSYLPSEVARPATLSVQAGCAMHALHRAERAGPPRRVHDPSSSTPRPPARRAPAKSPSPKASPRHRPAPRRLDDVSTPGVRWSTPPYRTKTAAYTGPPVYASFAGSSAQHAAAPPVHSAD